MKDSSFLQPHSDLLLHAQCYPSSYSLYSEAKINFSKLPKIKSNFSFRLHPMENMNYPIKRLDMKEACVSASV